jgi:ABC-type dipeptide/oligopeptide/nickel transport system ATPase component
MLEVKNLETIFSTQDGVVNAVNDISFSQQSGEAIGIVGESGCGSL